MRLAYEPFRPVAGGDPYPVYARLREEAPVYWAEEAHAFCVSRYEDVLAVLRSAGDFSSDAMRTMLAGVRPGVDPMSDPATLARLMAFGEAFPFPPEQMMTARNLIAEDPPRHGPLRALVNRGFTPRRIAAWEPRIRAIAAECIANLRGDDPFDLVAGLSAPLPVRVIAELLGVESARHADFKRWSDHLISGTTGSARGGDLVASGFTDAMRALCAYLESVAVERARAPGDDLVSVIVAAQDGDTRLALAEVVLFVLLLLGAGNETTTNLIGNAVLALLAHPEQLERLRADRSLLPRAIEETLRWDSPVQFVFRRATRDVELSGVRIPAGATVTALIGSANRDERQWGPTAEEFRIDRDAQGHIAFGFGNHFCLGASLARLEARVALDALLNELPALRRSDGRVEYVDSFLVRGPRRLELRRAA